MDRFSEKAATWDDDADHVSRSHAVAAAIRSAVPLNPETTCLEIGGGTGLLSRALAPDIATSTVTDVAPGMIDAARAALDSPRYAGWRAELFDIEHDELPAERYDLIVGLLALHHMGDVAAVVRRGVELLNPGGHVAFADLDRDEDGAFHASVHDFDGHDGFTRDDVERWLSEAGLVDVRISTAGSVTKEVHDGEREFPLFLATARRDG